MILEINRQYFAIRTEPESHVPGADLRHFLPGGVIERNRKRLLADNNPALGGFEGTRA